jgi:hypothetical protein
VPYFGSHTSLRLTNSRSNDPRPGIPQLKAEMENFEKSGTVCFWRSRARPLAAALGESPTHGRLSGPGIVRERLSWERKCTIIYRGQSPRARPSRGDSRGQF